jgi:hypothetical protein
MTFTIQYCHIKKLKKLTYSSYPKVLIKNLSMRRNNVVINVKSKLFTIEFEGRDL